MMTSTQRRNTVEFSRYAPPGDSFTPVNCVTPSDCIDVPAASHAWCEQERKPSFFNSAVSRYVNRFLVFQNCISSGEEDKSCSFLLSGLTFTKIVSFKSSSVLSVSLVDYSMH